MPRSSNYYRYTAQNASKAIKRWMHLLVIIVIRLLEQEVRGELLVLVTCEVGLDGEVTVETKSAELGFWLVSFHKWVVLFNLLSR